MADYQSVRDNIFKLCDNYMALGQQIPQYEQQTIDASNKMNQSQELLNTISSSLAQAESEANSLMAQAQSAAYDESGMSDTSWIRYRLETVRSEIINLRQQRDAVSASLNQARADYQSAQQKLNQATAERENIATKLDGYQSKMIGFAEQKEQKIDEFDKAIAKFKELAAISPNSTITSQTASLTATRNQHATDLERAREIIDKIESTLSSGNGSPKVLRRY